MARGEEIVRQIGALAEELGEALAGAQGRIETLTAELAEARTGGADLLAAKQGELETAEKRIETLVHKLKEARQEAAEAQERVGRELQQRLEMLERAAEEAREELAQERSIRKRLEKGAATDEKRLNELEKALAEGKGGTAGNGGKGKSEEAARLQVELSEALETVIRERQGREELEDQLAESHKLIEALEKALKRGREIPGESAGGAREGESRQLAEQLAAVESQLEEARREGGRWAKAHADAEKRIADLEQASGAAGSQPPAPGPEAGAVAKSLPEKPLPHEVRSPPRPGALFRPDWDLKGLPCKSADQVLQAWGSVFNVQLSLEGYPSQYCTAFLVVLKQGKQKQLYLLFNLKMNRHVLVCVPSKPPGDEAALNKLIGEGQKYLQMSGFELEKLKPEDVDHILAPYFKA